MTHTQMYKLSKNGKAIATWTAGTGLFLAFGIGVLLYGFWMTGWSIIDWLQSPYAFTFFVILAACLLVGMWALLELKRSKLGA